MANDASLESTTFSICKNICKFGKVDFFAKSSYRVKKFAKKMSKKGRKIYIFEKPLTNDHAISSM